MGKRGPQKTPTAVLKLRGSWRAGERAEEPEPMGTPTCPGWLGDVAKAMWHETVGLLMKAGIVSQTDSNAIARYCQLYERWRKCEELIQKHGTMVSVKNENGKVVGMKEAPYVDRAGRLSDQLLRLEQHFGMTPASRASVTTSKKKDDKPDGKSRFFNPTG